MRYIVILLAFMACQEPPGFIAEGDGEIYIGNQANITDRLTIDAGAGVVVIGEEDNYKDSAVRFFDDGTVEISAPKIILRGQVIVYSDSIQVKK